MHVSWILHMLSRSCDFKHAESVLFFSVSLVKIGGKRKSKSPPSVLKSEDVMVKKKESGGILLLFWNSALRQLHTWFSSTMWCMLRRRCSRESMTKKVIDRFDALRVRRRCLILGMTCKDVLSQKKRGCLWWCVFRYDGVCVELSQFKKTMFIVHVLFTVYFCLSLVFFFYILWCKTHIIYLYCFLMKSVI